MGKDLSHYNELARLFEYPGLSYQEGIFSVKELLGQKFPEASADVAEFLKQVSGKDLSALQDLFIRSFDVQAITTLDVGYVLFGDDYKRGELLSNLNREHRAVSNDCRHELADHLPNVLRLLPLLSDEELRQDLVQEILAPAIRKMILEFSEDRVAQKQEAYRKHYKTLLEKPGNTTLSKQDFYIVYQHLLKALEKVLKRDFSFQEKAIPEYTGDFLNSITKENVIEEKAEQPHYKEHEKERDYDGVAQ
jgi:nitrate reductase assembly molybdenum cofactor insertion protein NarJ